MMAPYDSTPRGPGLPPKEALNWRAFGLAILAHVVLVLSLVVGLNWKTEAEGPLQVELFMDGTTPVNPPPSKPEPKPEPEPTPTPEPQPEPPPPPPPPPPPVAKAAPEPKPMIDPEIALEEERKRRAELERAQLEKEAAVKKAKEQAAQEQQRINREREQAEQQERDRLDQERKKTERLEREAQEKLEKEEAARKAEILKKQETAKKVAEEKKKKEEEAKKAKEAKEAADKKAKEIADKKAKAEAAKKPLRTRRSKRRFAAMRSVRQASQVVRQIVIKPEAAATMAMAPRSELAYNRGFLSPSPSAAPLTPLRNIVSICAQMARLRASN